MLGRSPWYKTWLVVVYFIYVRSLDYTRPHHSKCTDFVAIIGIISIAKTFFDITLFELDLFSFHADAAA